MNYKAMENKELLGILDSNLADQIKLQASLEMIRRLYLAINELDKRVAKLEAKRHGWSF